MAPDMPTLADVLAAARARGRPHPGRPGRPEIRGADKVCRVLGMPPDAVPAHPEFLRQKLAAVAPAASGIEVRRWANVRSLLHKALGYRRHQDHAGPVHGTALPGLAGEIPGDHRPLDQARAEPADPLLFGAGHRARRRERRDCFGLPPGPGGGILVKDARAVWRNALTCWNRAVLEVPGWPQQRLAVPPLEQRYGLGPDCFPESFRLEVEAWLTRLAGGKFLEQSAFKPLRPATVRQPASANPRTGLGPGGPGA